MVSRRSVAGCSRRHVMRAVLSRGMRPGSGANLRTQRPLWFFFSPRRSVRVFLSAVEGVQSGRLPLSPSFAAPATDHKVGSPGIFIPTNIRPKHPFFVSPTRPALLVSAFPLFVGVRSSLHDTLTDPQVSSPPTLIISNFRRKTPMKFDDRIT